MGWAKQDFSAFPTECPLFTYTANVVGFNLPDRSDVRYSLQHMHNTGSQAFETRIRIWSLNVGQLHYLLKK
jgi:hypothetical protein